MNNTFAVMERFAPEAIQIMKARYRVLRQVLHNQPIGRRQLGRNLGCTERLVRAEVDTLRSWGALQTTAAGIYLTPYGEEMLRNIDEIVPYLFNIQNLADKLKERYGLEEVIVVPGDSFLDDFTQEDLGRAAAEYLRKKLFSYCILAVTGGSTLAQVANAMRPGVNVSHVCVVPARGGLGENVEVQAGNIAAKIARAIGGQYRLLHIPDNIEEKTAEVLKRDMHFSEVIKTIKSAHILVHGIGPALEMASRRGLSEAEIAYLRENEARGESLRYYFDQWGKIIFEIPGIGLDRDDLQNIKLIIAVAGGSNKASAIEAVLKNGQEIVLITDEGAAQRIIFGKDDG